jgi:hypothetical protein
MQAELFLRERGANQRNITTVLVYHICLARTVRAAIDFKTVSENK